MLSNLFRYPVNGSTEYYCREQQSWARTPQIYQIRKCFAAQFCLFICTFMLMFNGSLLSMSLTRNGIKAIYMTIYMSSYT